MEIVLITIGILMAFGLEAWWAEHGLREQQLSYLVEIRQEFSSTIAQLDSLSEESHARAQRFARLQAALLDGGQGSGADSVALWARGLRFFNSFEPTMPAYDDLMDSAGLVRVTSVDLRRAIRNYEYALRGLREYEDYVNLSLTSSWEPTLSSRVPSRAADGDLMPPVHRLAADLEFVNLVESRRSVDEALGSLRHDLSVVASEVLRQVDAELGG